MGCDEGPAGRADAAFVPVVDEPEVPTSAIESFDFDRLALDLLAQAEQPVDPSAPGVCEGDAACAVNVADRALTGQRNPAALDTACIFTSTVSGAGIGAATAEVVSTSCVGGGVLVGIVTSETGVGAIGGFGVAAVCGAADVTQIDAIAGGLAGAVTGLLGGVTLCEGGVVDQASSLIDWIWGTEPESIPVYQMQTPAIPGLGSASLTCESSPSNTESAYHDDSACGSDAFSMVCEPGEGSEERCAEWKDLADRNLRCHWARIVSANTFRQGQPDANHISPIRATWNHYDDCYWLIHDNCEEEHDPISQEDAQDAALQLICG